MCCLNICKGWTTTLVLAWTVGLFAGCQREGNHRTLGGHNEGVYAVQFSPDGKLLASASSDSRTGAVKVWDAGSGRCLLTIQTSSETIAFSPDSKRLATASGDPAQPSEITIWDVGTGKEARTLRGHAGKVSGLAFSPDGARLASASIDHTVRLWDAATGDLVNTMQGGNAEFWSIAYSPDGKLLAAASWNQSSGAIEIWDAASGQSVRTIQAHAKPVTGLAFSPD